MGSIWFYINFNMFNIHDLVSEDTNYDITIT